MGEAIRPADEEEAIKLMQQMTERNTEPGEGGNNGNVAK